MKNRALDHSDDWATPPEFYETLDEEFKFDFDPCPFHHDLSLWDGLEIEWGACNFVNPPYSRALKEAFVKKAIEEKEKGKTSVMLLPVSTSTRLFHDYIKPFSDEIRFVRGRIKFIGVNTKGEYVNWHLWNRPAPEGVTHVRNSGMHDSMVVVFRGIQT
jgi:site-specific DNA-methyltransferase (adenine-specific)